MTIGERIEAERAEAGSRYLASEYRRLAEGFAAQHRAYLARSGVTLATARKRARRFADWRPECGAAVFRKPAGGYDAYYGDADPSPCVVVERIQGRAA